MKTKMKNKSTIEIKEIQKGVNSPEPKHLITDWEPSLSKENLDFVIDLAEKMTKQDNRATQYPLFYIYERKEVWTASDNAQRTMFVDEEGNEVTEHEDEDGTVWKHDTKFDEWKSEDETIQSYEAESKFDLRKVDVREEEFPVVDVGPFFTEEAAQAHIDANYYHYTKPFIYVNSAWRNYELQGILKVIFELAGMEVPSQYK